MSFAIPCLPCVAPIKRPVKVAAPVAITNLSHKAGSSRLTPNSITIPPDITAQITAGTPKSSVVALRRSVNKIIETTKLVIITSGCLSDTFFWLFCCNAPPPITTGSNGKIHGAKTVNTPATNETIYSSII